MFFPSAEVCRIFFCRVFHAFITTHYAAIFVSFYFSSFKVGANGRPIIKRNVKFTKIPAKLCLDGWGQFCIFFCFVTFKFFNFSKKRIYRGDLGQHLEHLSSRSWIRRGIISCAPHTSFDETNDRVVNSERGELVRGSDPLVVYSSALSTASDVWRAAIRLLLKTQLAAGV